MGWPEIAAVAMFIALVLYVLTGGADFGGGAWSFLTRLRGDVKTARVAEKAIAPIWEANHVWLIVIIVVMFVCFPSAFSFFSTTLHVPLTIALVGIVLRGAAFVFSAYGMGDQEETAFWKWLFGFSSLVTPVIFGQMVGAIAVGSLQAPEVGMAFADVYLFPWMSVFSLVCGGFTVLLFAYLAAIYLTIDADTEGAREMYRLYAMATGIALGVVAFLSVVALATTPGDSQLFERLFGAWWSIPLHILTGLSAMLTFYFLYKWSFPQARMAAVVQVCLILLGWGAAQYPYLIPTTLTIRGAATESTVIAQVVAILGLGSVVLIPSFAYLYKIFKPNTFGTE